MAFDYNINFLWPCTIIWEILLVPCNEELLLTVFVTWSNKWLLNFSCIFFLFHILFSNVHPNLWSSCGSTVPNWKEQERVPGLSRNWGQRLILSFWVELVSGFQPMFKPILLTKRPVYSPSPTFFSIDNLVVNLNYKRVSNTNNKCLSILKDKIGSKYVIFFLWTFLIKYFYCLWFIAQNLIYMFEFFWKCFDLSYISLYYTILVNYQLNVIILTMCNLR